MNLLFISQGRTIEDQCSYDSAFRALQQEGVLGYYVNLPLFGGAERLGWMGLWEEIVHICRDQSIDLVFFQFFHGTTIESPAACVRRIKALPQRPVIAVSGGDLFSANPMLRRPPRVFEELSRLADVTFLTSMGSFAEYLARRGSKRLTLLPHGFPDTRFRLGDATLRQSDPIFDVVMVNSRGNMLNLCKYTGWAAFQRKRVADTLYRRYGKRFALFGHGWGRHPALQGPVEFSRQADAFSAGRVVVDGRPPFTMTYYASDRPFYVAGVGVPLVQFHTPRFEKIFRQDEHAYYTYGCEDVCSVCDRILADAPSVVAKRVQSTVELIRSRHTLGLRAKTLVSVMREVRESMQKGILKGLKDRIDLPFFLPEVDMHEERRFALINWE